MSNLVPLLLMLESTKAEELRLLPNQVPSVVVDGKRRDMGSQPMNARLIQAAASDLLSQSDIDDLPSNRPRTIRHEQDDVLYVIELSRTPDGIALLIRPAKAPAPPVRAPSPMPAAAAAPPSPPKPASEPPPKRSRRSTRPPRQEAPPARAAQPAEPSAAAVIRNVRPGTVPPIVPIVPIMPITPVVRESPRAAPGMARIDVLLREMLAAKASDLHLSAGNHPVMRVHGEIHFGRDKAVLSSQDIVSLVDEIFTDKAKRDFAELRDADFAHEIPGIARFRVNVFEDRNGVGAVLRQIPIEIIPADKLGLPKACIDLCQLSKGLVVVTGPTGSGKSTTLAAMIDWINKNRSDHIITIEDPVEFVHKNIKCLVNQREVGQNTKSFKAALRAALREDPDIVLVGEMRDLETVAIAIETAETGHLVFGTLHTTTAVSTVDRIIDQFPTDRQAQIRVMLSESLKGVVAQVLCKKIGGGRVAAQEVMLGTTAVASLIREGKTFQLPSVLQTSKNIGMVTMNDALLTLVQKKEVEPKEAWMKATDKAGLLSIFKGAGLPVTFN